MRADVGLLDHRAAVRSHAADLGWQKRSKTGRCRLEADLPHAFEAATVFAGADSAAYGVCDNHKIHCRPGMSTGHWFPRAIYRLPTQTGEVHAISLGNGLSRASRYRAASAGATSCVARR